MREPQRPVSRSPLPQFSIGTLLAVIPLCALVFYFIVNRTDCGADATLVISERLPFAPPSQQPETPRPFSGTPIAVSAESLDSQFVSQLLANPKVHDLQTFKQKSDPEKWIRSHVSIEVEPNTDLVTIRVSGNSYRDEVSDFIPLVDALIETLKQATKSDWRVQVLSLPEEV